MEYFKSLRFANAGSSLVEYCPFESWQNHFLFSIFVLESKTSRVQSLQCLVTYCSVYNDSTLETWVETLTNHF
jgi:hypothetical protein